MLKSIMKKDRTAFTASVPLEDLSSGRYIDFLTLSFKGDMTAASAVLPAALMALVDPIEVRLFGSPVVSLNASDLYAMNLLVFGHNPFTLTATAATNSQSKIDGLKVPLWQPPRAKGNLNYSVTRAAVSGVDTETITIAEISSDKLLHPRWLHYVNIPWTSSAATGYGDEIPLPSRGDLIGLLIWSTTIPTATTETATLQAVRLQVDGQIIYEREWHDMAADTTIGFHDLGASPADWSVIDNYRFIDFRKDPIKMVGEGSSSVTLQLNTGVASEAVRILPIYLTG